MLVVKKGDMFANAPKGAFLLHACNAKGVWGSGIAKTFKDRFPDSFKEYLDFCLDELEDHDDGATGLALIAKDKIVCLVTSFDYGTNKDSPDTILRNTATSLGHFFEQCIDFGLEEIDVHSPKINSGLFAVPWESTASTIDEYIAHFRDKHNLKVNWTVWEL